MAVKAIAVQLAIQVKRPAGVRWVETGEENQGMRKRVGRGTYLDRDNIGRRCGDDEHGWWE